MLAAAQNALRVQHGARAFADHVVGQVGMIDQKHDDVRLIHLFVRARDACDRCTELRVLGDVRVMRAHMCALFDQSLCDLHRR